MCWPFVDVWLEDPPEQKKKKKKKEKEVNRPETGNWVWIYVSAVCVWPAPFCLRAISLGDGLCTAPGCDIAFPTRSRLERGTGTKEEKISLWPRSHVCPLRRSRHNSNLVT